MSARESLFSMAVVPTITRTRLLNMLGDSSVQLAEYSNIQFAGDEPFGRVSGISSILTHKDGPLPQESPNTPPTQRAVTAEMGFSVSSASGQIGFGTHTTKPDRKPWPPTSVSNPFLQPRLTTQERDIGGRGLFQLYWLRLLQQ